ncbi:hypothetical protein GOQ27_02450 [Clostridium sp. D2Q-11]|uniref:Uncharacterized protein n=1 Tax=Anaeromonas frigoriresistens TaxID=2683708 RepID=A0A942UZG5_9FIRM|nr:hypothetical protein [Anaeromonas frigoriresistens]MBS4537302.1 hypothetical protein [Anaeromonas frigoriresistens]
MRRYKTSHNSFYLECMKGMNEALLGMLENTNPKVGYIASQSDPCRKFFKKAKDFYESIGINSINYFDIEEEYQKENEGWLFNSDIIHLSSGNTC